ncbi:MAG: hypothetical protein M1813_009202 [Trichoglossum hirsutum]|nr:MAG: hypothetical protein M1813_009202 [Trichoglossum hirsutum]
MHNPCTSTGERDRELPPPPYEEIESEIALPLFESPPYEERQSGIAPPLFKKSPPSTDFTLIFDGRSVFEATRPSVALYQTSRPIDAGGCELIISRLRKPSETNEGNPTDTAPLIEPFDDSKVIYSIARSPIDTIHMDLTGKRRTTYPGFIKSEKTLVAWEFWHEHKGDRTPLFRATRVLSLKSIPDTRWKDATQRTLATVKQQTDGDRHSPQIMTISDGVSPPVLEALVACWMAKAWYSARPAVAFGMSKFWRYAAFG